MKLMENILVPVDFSAITAEVLTTAAAVSRTFGSEICLQHVLPPFDDSTDASKRVLEMARSGAVARLQECRERLEQQQAKVAQVWVDQGIPWKVIVDRAEQHDVNVVVLGATSHPDRWELALGTTADTVRRTSLKPVWMVRPGGGWPFRSIVCPVDFGPASERALQNAIHLARHFSARLTVLTVIPPQAGWMSMLYSPDAAAEREYADQETRRFEEFLQRFDFRGVAWEKAVRQGIPAEQIVELLSAEPAELLVMGSAWKSGLWRMFVGSVSAKVADEVRCSVMTMVGEDAIRVKIDEELTDLKTHYARARELLDNGFAAESLHLFERCVHINPMFVPGWEGLAEAYARLGQKERADDCRESADRMQKSLAWGMVEAEIRAKHPLWKGSREM